MSEKVNEIGDQILDEMAHGQINNRAAYDKRLAEVAGGEAGQDFLEEVETYMHNKESYGFCDMCQDVLFYDDETWYSLDCAEQEEYAKIEENIDKVCKKYGSDDIQDVCPICWHELLGEEEYA